MKDERLHLDGGGAVGNPREDHPTAPLALVQDPETADLPVGATSLAAVLAALQAIPLWRVETVRALLERRWRP
jgi:hypothetical protein